MRLRKAKRNRPACELSKLLCGFGANLIPTLLFAAALTHGAYAQVPGDDHLIVPAKRIGAAALGMTIDQLIGVMGQPKSKWPGSVDIYNWQNDLSAMVTKDGLWSTQLCTFSADYATQQGVHPGSTDKSLTTLLGPPKYSRVFNGWWRFSYTNLYWPGLVVSVHLKGYAKNHAVWRICVNHFSGDAEE